MDLGCRTIGKTFETFLVYRFIRLRGSGRIQLGKPGFVSLFNMFAIIVIHDI